MKKPHVGFRALAFLVALTGAITAYAQQEKPWEKIPVPPLH